MTGSDLQPVIADRESLLIVLCNDPVEQISREIFPAGRRFLQKLINTSPALIIKNQPDSLRIMSKNQTEKLTEWNEILDHRLGFHFKRNSSLWMSS